MSTPSHIATGYLLANVFMQHGVLPLDPSGITLWMGVLTSNIPDVDMLAVWKMYDHRTNSPFHYPFTWVSSLGATALIAWAMDAPWLLPYILFFVTAILTHFVLDSVGVNAGICWLAPFNLREFSFIRLKYGHMKSIRELPRWMTHYLTHPVMILEIALWLGAIFVFLKQA